MIKLVGIGVAVVGIILFGIAIATQGIPLGIVGGLLFILGIVVVIKG